jgi:hypothetical protein
LPGNSGADWGIQGHAGGTSVRGGAQAAVVFFRAHDVRTELCQARAGLTAGGQSREIPCIWIEAASCGEMSL